jgi:hypothetical protein
VNVITSEKQEQFLQKIATALNVDEWTDLIPIAITELYKKYSMLGAESLQAAFASYVSEA